MERSVTEGEAWGGEDSARSSRTEGESRVSIKRLRSTNVKYGSAIRLAFARRPLISSSYLDADPPGSSSALDPESVSDAKTTTESFSLEIATTHHVYDEASRSSSSFSYFYTRSFLLATLFTTGRYPPFTYRPSYCRRIIQCSTAPFAITRAGAECRRRDANISDARAILSRPSRFRVFLEKLCNDARRFTPGRTWLRTYFTPRIG